MIEIEGIDPAKVEYLPSGVRLHAPPGGAGASREELGLAAARPLVGTVCGLRPQKALDVLVRAAALLAADVPDVRVLIVGEGPERGGSRR